MSKVIAPFLFIAVSAGLFFSYIDPAYKGVQALVVLNNDLEAALAKATVLQKTREQRLESFNDLGETDVARLHKMLPDNVDNVRVIIELDSIASRYGISLRNFTFTQRAPYIVEQASETVTDVTPLYGTAILTFSASAEYQDVLAFLTDVETNLRLTDVQRVGIAPSGASRESGALQYDITLQTYWLP